MNRIVTDYIYDDMIAEYELCPLRLYYGYILDKYPVHVNEFVHQFIFSDLIRVARDFSGYKNRRAIQAVSDLFPQWSDFKKKNIANKSIDSLKDQGNRIETIDDVTISERRKRLIFPGIKQDCQKKLIDSSKKKKHTYLKLLLNPGEEQEINMTAKPGFHCRYCPFLDICPERVFPLDEKKNIELWKEVAKKWRKAGIVKGKRFPGNEKTIAKTEKIKNG